MGSLLWIILLVVGCGCIGYVFGYSKASTNYMDVVDMWEATVKVKNTSIEILQNTIEILGKPSK